MSARLLLALLLTSMLAASEARLLLPDCFPPGTPIDGTIEIVDGGSPVAGFEFPSIAGMSWERAPGQDTVTLVRNGVVTTSERHRLRLTVVDAGEVVIPAIGVRLLDGRHLTTAPRTVAVRAGDPRLIGQAVCWAEFEPASVIIGQPVTLRLTCAFADPSLQIERFGLEPPAQATVIASDEASAESYAGDGRRWSTRVRRWTLTFAEPGTVVVRGQQEYVPCEAFAGSYVAIGPRRRTAIAAATLVVRPLPPGGKPAGWNGLVAPVTVTATLDRERIAVGEGTRLTVRVHGAQAGLLARPALPAVAGLEARARDEAGGGGGDERAFVWDLQPAAAGLYTVLSPDVAFLDPTLETFRSASAAALSLRVDPGNAAPMTIAGVGPEPAPSGPSAVAMPAPLAGSAPRIWSPGALGGAVLLAMLASAGATAAARWRPRPPALHRGRALQSALRAGDLARAAQAAAALRQDLPLALMTTADAFEAALTAARFGGAAADRLSALAAPLEELP